MKGSSRTLCILGFILWMGFGLVCPVWVGQGYSPDSVSNPTQWRKDGVFGLHGAGAWVLEAWQKMAPLWSPPEPQSRDRSSSVRWPWQPVSSSHVEVSWHWMSAYWSAGIILLGMALRLRQKITPVTAPDPLFVFVWPMSLSHLMAWLCIIGTSVLTMGMILEMEGVFFGVLLAGLVFGGILGFRSYQQSYRATGIPCAATGEACDADEASSPAAPLWFLLGSKVGFTLSVLEKFVVEPVLPRGRRIGTGPFLQPLYDRDQFPIDLAVGLGLVTTGWIIGVALIKWGAPRWLGIGVITTSTAIGATFPF